MALAERDLPLFAMSVNMLLHGDCTRSYRKAQTADLVEADVEDCEAVVGCSQSEAKRLSHASMLNTSIYDIVSGENACRTFIGTPPLGFASMPNSCHTTSPYSSSNLVH